MLLRLYSWAVVAGVACSSVSTQQCSESDDDKIIAAPQLAMLQKRSEMRITDSDAKPKHQSNEITSAFLTARPLSSIASTDTDKKKKKKTASFVGQQATKTFVYRWGVNTDKEHPQFIGKWAPHPKFQQYEANLPHLTGIVLNIFSKQSDGDGGLVLAMEVLSACDETKWVEVDRTRCSARYPCALRLPAGAVRGNETVPTKFRTTVIAKDEDYLTSFLEYDRVTLDHDAEVKVAYQSFSDDRNPSLLETKPPQRRILKFKVGAVVASGGLSVTPVLQGATSGTTVTMRLRQPDRGHLNEWGLDPEAKVALNQADRKPKTKKHIVVEEEEESGDVPDSVKKKKKKTKEDSGEPHSMLSQSTGKSRGEITSRGEMIAMEEVLHSYRAPWSSQWRAPAKVTGGCDHALFEVVSDQLYPGDVELEIWATGDSETTISDVLVTSRVSWAEAEVTLLETFLKDHFGYFLDPEVIVHGLAMDAYKKEDPKRLPDSNPTGWGYAMESWVVMAEMGVISPEETAAKLQESFQTLESLQQDPNQFAHGLFYPYYSLRSREDGSKIFPVKTLLTDLPCGDGALFYASMMLVQGWLMLNKFESHAAKCSQILGRMKFDQCQRITNCNDATNGQSEAEEDSKGDEFWSVPLTVEAETLQQSSYNWNVWADEGGVVATIVALSGAINVSQYQSVVRQQQRYSPCTHWEGITVGNAAFFNSIFTLPTRSMLGLGTLFATPYYHEFAVRTVLPSFRAHQKLKKKLGVSYIGPSDAMTVMPKNHPGKVYGSYAYWPPNNMYDCRKGKSTGQNQCTWCKGIQYEGLEDPFDIIVPHGNMASFVAMAMMEKSQFSAWLEDSKLLMTDASGVYTPGYGLEVVAPARRTESGQKFEGAFDGRNVWEALSHGYTILSIYEGLATMRRRYELAKQAGLDVPGSYKPPEYRPLADFTNAVPQVRSAINKLLAVASEQKSTERQCDPSSYGPAS